jgi:3-phenylpropionate/cinnamic acid dioxygenase small subunit
MSDLGGETQDGCARQEIQDLLARLAHLADDGTIEDYVELFTSDAVWELLDPSPAGAAADRRVGRSDIAAGVRQRRAAGMQGPGTSTRHLISTVCVQVQSADEASSIAYWMFFAEAGSTPRMTGLGRYDDVFRRTGAGWRLAHRAIRVG